MAAILFESQCVDILKPQLDYLWFTSFVKNGGCIVIWEPLKAVLISPAVDAEDD